MCGILGGNIDTWNYTEGINRIRHRGPDAVCVKKFPKMTLAFTRLAIMDLDERAMQPMCSSDEQVWIVYNGEIYGFDKLKNELEKKYIFYTTSDTEVILNAYLEYGEGFIDRIDGMFAIVILDLRTQELRLYRDRAGIKPLFYYDNGRRFAFASELKAIETACIDEDLKIDYTALYDYLFYNYIPTPKTMYQNCFKVPPATMIVYSLKEMKIKEQRRYWKLHVNTSVGRRRKRDDIEEAIRFYIEKSVKEQMVADVKVGTYLSGGIDSSIISYYCHEFEEDIHVFSIGFEDAKYDETKYARMLAEKYHINFCNQMVKGKDIKDLRGMMKEWYDEPFADASAYPTYLLSKMAKNRVSVVLTGDGGDELFGGYPSCEKMYATSKRGMLNKVEDFLYMRRFYCGGCSIGVSPLKIFCDLRCNTVMYENYKQLAEKWHISREYDILWYFKKYYIPELPLMTRSRYLDFKTYLPDDVLTKVDRVSMAVSLESRVPFLSRELIEFSFSLSQEECFEDNLLKGSLKGAYKKIIPNEILYRKKQGFNAPPQYVGVPSNKKTALKFLESEWEL